MIDLQAIEGFEWDDGNAQKSQRKHDVSQAEAEQVFLTHRLLLLPDEKHRPGEARYHAYGHTTAGRWLHLTFTLRRGGTYIRVISARDMNRKERRRYEKAVEIGP